jgi:hypothetical protein
LRERATPSDQQTLPGEGARPDSLAREQRLDFTRVDTLPHRLTLMTFRGELREELRDRDAETL